MGESKIEWTEQVWNVITGCSKISTGCDNCYAAAFAPRLAGRYGYDKDDPFKVTFHKDRLDLPLKWKKPSRIFVNSMGDLFHKDVPDDLIDQVFAVMALSPQHTFLILTKRPERMLEYMKSADWGHSMNTITDSYIRRLESPLYSIGEITPPLPNVHLGVSIEDQKTANERIPLLLQTSAFKRFVSYEPAIGPVDISPWIPPFENCGSYEEGCLYSGNVFGHSNKDPRPGILSCKPEYCVFGCRGLDWVVLGGENGRGARPMHPDWARLIRDECKAARVPFFFKGWGGWMPGDQINPTSELFDLVKRQGKLYGIETLKKQNKVKVISEKYPGFLWRVASHNSGDLLDGIEHKEVAE